MAGQRLSSWPACWQPSALSSRQQPSAEARLQLASVPLTRLTPKHPSTVQEELYMSRHRFQRPCMAALMTDKQAASSD